MEMNRIPNKLTCHEVSPGDYVLAEGWSTGRRVLCVNTVAKNYVTDNQGNKYSYSIIYGIPCTEEFLDMFDFADFFLNEDEPCPTHVYQRDQGSIKLAGDYVVMDVLVKPGEGKTCSETMLHEFQHLYFDARHEECPLKLKEKYREV